MQFYRRHERQWRGWAFRGQTKKQLVPKLEESTDRYDLPVKERQRLEEALIREFRRHYHRYDPAGPRERDSLEWLSIMRHYGAPTRLLDWSYSFWVALYFATARAKPGKPSYVWAIDPDWLWDCSQRQLDPWLDYGLRQRFWNNKNPLLIETILFGQQSPAVFPLNPTHLNARLAAQQGLFLAPTQIELKFQANLDAVLDRAVSDQRLRCIQIKWTADSIRSTLKGLRRMGITGATLFPDLAGLAEGLETFLVEEPFEPCG